MSRCCECDRSVAAPIVFDGHDYCAQCAPESHTPSGPNVQEVHGAIEPGDYQTKHDLSAAGRRFPSGAYRDSDAGKADYEGYLSPLVIRAYGEYMTRHRLQSDGQLRDSDNWQLGIPREQYVKSAFRHFVDLWMEHRGYPSRDGIDEALGGLLFNICGYWHEHLKGD